MAEPVAGCKIHDNLPSKIKHIKNSKFLDNTWDPVAQKYVKSIWLHKITKLNREKYDLIWQYYRNRHKNSVGSVYKLHHERRFKIIYFSDPIEHIIEVDHNMVLTGKSFDDLVVEKYKPLPKEERRRILAEKSAAKRERKKQRLLDEGKTLVEVEEIMKKKSFKKPVKVKVKKKVEKLEKPNFFKPAARRAKKEKKLAKAEAKRAVKERPLGRSKYSGVKNVDKYDKEKRALLKEKKNHLRRANKKPDSAPTK